MLVYKAVQAASSLGVQVSQANDDILHDDSLAHKNILAQTIVICLLMQWHTISGRILPQAFWPSLVCGLRD